MTQKVRCSEHEVTGLNIFSFPFAIFLQGIEHLKSNKGQNWPTLVYTHILYIHGRITFIFSHTVHVRNTLCLLTEAYQLLAIFLCFCSDWFLSASLWLAPHHSAPVLTSSWTFWEDLAKHTSASELFTLPLVPRWHWHFTTF
jgi:hypothetical protein